MDHLEIWKHISKVQATWLGLVLGLIVAIVLHIKDSRKSRNRKKKLIK